jgi:pimeloyl-ACP methyl ester carboxylesterase
MPVAALDSGPLAYREVGPPDGPIALLVHGVLVGGTVWSRTEAELCARGWRVITPTLPLGCHANAMPATADLSPSGVARLLHELVAALAIDGCTLVGNDTGGALCQFAIDQDPTPFAALVLTNCDAFTDFPPRPFGWLRWVGRRPRLLRALYGPMRATVVRRAAYRVLARRPIPGEVTRQWWATYVADAGVRRDAQRFLASVDPQELDVVTRRLATYDRPVTLCWAVEDRLFTEAHGRRLHAIFRDATFVPVHDSRAFVMWDRPDAVAAAVAGARAVS